MDGAGGQIDSASLHRTPQEADRLARSEVFGRVFRRIKRDFFIFLSSIFLSAAGGRQKNGKQKNGKQKNGKQKNGRQKDEDGKIISPPRPSQPRIASGPCAGVFVRPAAA